MIWCLEAYDTEMRKARSRSYTSSRRTAEMFEKVPRIQFTDSGHGIVFIATQHSGRREPEMRHSQHVDTHMARLRREARS